MNARHSFSTATAHEPERFGGASIVQLQRRGYGLPSTTQKLSKTQSGTSGRSVQISPLTVPVRSG